jgi:hypothetical protein
MVWFDILDSLVFLPRGHSIMLVANVFVTVISYVVSSMVKTLSRS